MAPTAPTVAISSCRTGVACSWGPPARVPRRTGVTLRTSSQAPQWDGGPRALLIVLAVVLGLAVALYHYGVPFVARVAAEQIPTSALAGISRDVVDALDGGTFAPSTLPLERQRRLTRDFV